MFKKLGCVLAACALLLALGGCKARDGGEAGLEKARQQLGQSFETTARVKYRELEAVMKLYKKPMNCAAVTFEAPDSLRDMKMTFFTDRVTFSYKDLSFDFVPDSVPGKAASKLVVDAVNAALADEGVKVERQEGRLLVSGQLDGGEFLLTVDAESGNILKLSIPESELELEILNFKILE